MRLIKTNSHFAMDPDALEASIQKDRYNGLIPACVVASIGTTGVGAIDPIRKIGKICKSHNVFLHVDAAWAGAGVDFAQSKDGCQMGLSWLTVSSLILISG